jgi:hypothetical protein
MMLSVSTAIFMTKARLEAVRANELAMETRAIRSEYWFQHPTRAHIVGDNPAQVRQRNKKKAAEEAKIAKQIETLQLSSKHSQSVAAWVFTTRWFGPPSKYMRVMPLPVRSFV